MREKSFRNSDLGKYRYQLTTLRNVTQANASPPIPSSAWELLVNHNYTYDNLIERLQRHFHVDQPTASRTALQQYRNHASTLHGYLAYCGKTSSSPVGVELGSHFDEKLRSYCAQLDVAARTVRDRRAHLRLVQRLHLAVTKPSQDRTRNEPSSFTLELRAAISKTGVAPKALAREIGASPSALQRWLAGAVPNRRGLPSLRRLEARLGLPRDHLVGQITAPPRDHLGGHIAAPPRAHPDAPPAVPFREQLKARKNAAAVSLIPEDGLQPSFLEEWRALLDYKTAVMPLMERHPRGVWRCVPLDVAGALSPLAIHRGLACATADAVLGRLRDFLAVVTLLPGAKGGLAERAEGVQTLAWCVVPDALSAYLNHLTAASGGLRHGGHRNFAAVVASLLQPETGYLWQQPALRHRLPVSVRPESDDAWREVCARGAKLLKDAKRRATDVSRDPKDPIALLLQQDQPLQPILEAIARIDDEAAQAQPGSITEARLRRDALLLAMLLSNPLRVRAFVTMTWLGDGSGTLRGNSRDGWRIHLHRNQLKNGQGKAGKDYAVQVARWVQPRLESYLEEYRSTLLSGRHSRYLFVSARGSSGAGVGAWKTLPERVFKLTKRYVAGSPGFGAHAFRHLVATDWLQARPNDYLSVAELLNDSLPTVLAEYGHLRRDVSFSRYEERIESLLTEARPR